MKSCRARWLVTFAVSAFVVCGAGVASAKEHERGHAPATGAKPSWSSATCPDQVRPAPKPVAPAPAPKRVRPPASLPCCKGADCSCSGPPALAATPDSPASALPPAADARIGTAPRRAPTAAS